MSLLNEAKKMSLCYEKGQQLFCEQNIYQYLCDISMFWKNILEIEKTNYRTKQETEIIFKKLLLSKVKNKPINYVLILCPSYLKGRGQFGFKENIGETTINLILYLQNIVDLSKTYKISAKSEIWFSDLLVENYKMMDKLYVSNALDRNYQQIQNRVGEIAFVRKLSEIGNLKDTVGIEGKNTIHQIPDRIIKSIMLRSNKFYFDILGWTEHDVEERMKILAPSYQKIGEELNKDSFSIMIFGENNLERGKMYSGPQTPNSLVSIIYPKLEKK